MPTWEDVAWLREQWDGPFMLKGVMRVDDAKRAVDAGVTAISVSNHGGNNLDGTPGLDPGAARGRRRGRRPDRGAARRRHPPRRRRRQGARAGRQGRDDRPRLPVGPGRQRAGRRGERARPAARRPRLGDGRPRPPVGRASSSRDGPGHPARLRAPPRRRPRSTRRCSRSIRPAGTARRDAQRDDPRLRHRTVPSEYRTVRPAACGPSMRSVPIGWYAMQPSSAAAAHGRARDARLPRRRGRRARWPRPSAIPRPDDAAHRLRLARRLAP